METERFDAIGVGAGQVGPATAARCSREGLKTAVIERHHFEGTCVNTGGVPTKTLVAGTRAIRLAQRGAEFGFDVAGLRVNMARVMARKDATVAKSREGVESWLRGLTNTEVIVGDAHFVAAATVKVAGRRMTAPHIFRNVGGRAARPALPGIDAVQTLDNVSALKLHEVPCNSIGPPSGPTHAATSKSMTRAAPLPTVSGLWAAATGAGPSRTRHGTTMKSSSPTCSTTIHASFAIASPVKRYSLILHSGVSA